MTAKEFPTVRAQCEADGSVQLELLAHALHTPPASLEEALGCQRAMMDGDPSRGQRTGETLDRLVEVIDLILRRGGAPPAAWHWASTVPITSLGGCTAVELIRAGRAPALLTHLRRVNVGGFA